MKLEDIPEDVLPKEGRGLRAIDLELTNKCNLFCRHCYSGAGPLKGVSDKVPKERWKSLIDEAVSLGAKVLQITGGEPTLHENFLEILDYAFVKGPKRPKIYTNAFELNDEIINELKRTGSLAAFSFYSHNPEIHEEITRVKGSFEKTVKNLKKLVEAEVPSRGRVIITPYNNSQENFELAKKFLNSIGINDVRYDNMHAVGRAAEIKKEDEYSALCGECWHGKLTIDSSGDIYPCVMSRFLKLGNVMENSLSDILNESKLIEFRVKVYDMYVRNRK